MEHLPVLLHETIKGLNLRDNITVVDMTLGRGGHSSEILNSGYKKIKLVGIDADPDAITESIKLLQPIADKNNSILITAKTFNDDIIKVLHENSIEFAEAIMFDLGISSPQVDSSGRGFSFQKNEPLNMTMSNSGELTAQEIINTWEENSIADIIYGYGEERYAKRIAKAIVRDRKESVIETTDQLVDIIKGAVPSFYRHGKIHPATRTFQALRITVNNELERLKKSLRDSYEVLSPGGRMVVISFHSLEDRIVKRFFKELEESSKGVRITKKPLTPTKEEIIINKRARSAKLRIFEKNS